VILKIGDQLDIQSYSSFDKETYRDAMDSSLSTLPRGEAREASEKSGTPLGYFSIRNKTDADHFVAVRSNDDDECVVLNTRTGTASIQNAGEVQSPFHMVTIESDDLYRKWKTR